MGVLRYSVSGPNSADNPYAATLGAAATGFFGTRDHLRRQRLEEEAMRTEQAAQQERLRQYDRRLALAEESQAAEMEEMERMRGQEAAMQEYQSFLAMGGETAQKAIGLFGDAAFGYGEALERMTPQKHEVFARMAPGDQRQMLEDEQADLALQQEADDHRDMLNRSAVMSADVPDGDVFVQAIANEQDPTRRNELFLELRGKRQDVKKQQQLGTAFESVSTLLQGIDASKDENGPMLDMLSRIEGALEDGKLSPEMVLGALRPLDPELEQVMRNLGMDTSQVRAMQMAGALSQISPGEARMVDDPDERRSMHLPPQDPRIQDPAPVFTGVPEPQVAPHQATLPLHPSRPSHEPSQSASGATKTPSGAYASIKEEGEGWARGKTLPISTADIGTMGADGVQGWHDLFNALIEIRKAVRTPDAFRKRVESRLGVKVDDDLETKFSSWMRRYGPE